MRRRFAVVLLALGAMVAVGAGAAPATADSGRLVAYLFGANERPGPGDPDAVGRAVFDVNDDTNTICVSVQFTNITLPATGMHIHFAPPGVAGPIVVPFSPPQSFQDYQCVVVADEALLDNIVANPQQYYFNIHNREFPGGAMRGQLQPA